MRLRGRSERKEHKLKRSLSHTVWECKYHIVWVPKKRRKVIFGKLRLKIGAILRGLCQYKRVDVIEGKACLDHMHVCLAIPPKYSVSSMVGYLKGKSAMIAFEKCSRLKEKTSGKAVSGAISAQ